MYQIQGSHCKVIMFSDVLRHCKVIMFSDVLPANGESLTERPNIVIFCHINNSQIIVTVIC